MSMRRARLSLNGLEERLTPATAVDWMVAAGQTYAGMSFFQAIARDPEWIFNPAAQDFLEERLTSIFQGAQSAASVMGYSGPMAAQAQALAGLAVHVGD